jgi:hypothetical protein
LTDCGGDRGDWKDNIETTRWELVNWICPTCIDDYDPHKSDLPPPELAPVDTSDPDIDKKAVWGIGPDYDGFGYELWQAANNVDPLVYCRECKIVFRADFSLVSPINGGLDDSPREEVIKRARELNQDLGPAEIRNRIEELENSIASYREEYGHDSPEDAERFGDLAEEGAREWTRVRYERAVTDLALKLSEAVTILKIDQLETATADRDDWSGTTPADAGEAAFRPGLESIEDMPDLGRTPLPDRDEHESDESD